MKKILTFALLASACILSSCKKETFIIPDEAFSTLQVDSVSANNGWFDVVPANNDFYYMAINLDAAWYDLYKEAWIDTLDKMSRELYKILTEGEPNPMSFEEACLDKGAFLEPLFLLQGGTKYVAFGFPYEQNGVPRHKLTKFEYTTQPQPVSANTFSLTVSGSVATIKTTNNDTYFCYSERKDVIDKDYDGRPGYFFSEVIDYFWEYGFLEKSFLYRADKKADLSDYFDLKVGDKIYVMATGYDGGVSTEAYIFLVTYNGPDVPGTVEIIQPAGPRNSVQTIKDGIQRNIERRVRKSTKSYIVRR